MAPEQRGYGLTDGLDDPAQYDMQFICDDLAGMLDAKVLNERYFVVMTGVVRQFGRWTQQEQPDEVNSVIVDWMNRKIS